MSVEGVPLLLLPLLLLPVLPVLPVLPLLLVAPPPLELLELPLLPPLDELVAFPVLLPQPSAASVTQASKRYVWMWSLVMMLPRMQALARMIVGTSVGGGSKNV